MKKIVILGSTGSIGQNTLKVIQQYPHDFKVVGLSAHANTALLAKQVLQCKPEYVGISDVSKIEGFRACARRTGVRIVEGKQGLNTLACLKGVDLLVAGLVGSAGLEPIMHALQKGTNIAIANKEPLVMAGELIMRTAQQHKARILPIDSEHSAIFQCLEGKNRDTIEVLSLTASGGPLWGVPKKEFDRISVKNILQHPRWKMGNKISVDSATMMNKGFEAIEASVLFGVGMDRIRIVVHPEAVIHSMVEFVNGSVLAQMGVCSMQLPIQYALTYPHIFPMKIKRLDFAKIHKMHFYAPDYKKFPCIRLAYEAGTQQGTAPCVLSAADEELVRLFLEGKIKLSSFPRILEKVLSNHCWKKQVTLEEIYSYDQWAKQEVRRVCQL